LCFVSSNKHENKLAKLALVAVAAGVLTLGSVQDASAAKTGGRIGGQAFKSSAPRSSPRINNSRYGLSHHCLFSLLSYKSTLLAHHIPIIVTRMKSLIIVQAHIHGFGLLDQ